MAKDSVTKTIRRSQITLNPYNPKNHSDEEVKSQKADIKRVGFLGGIVWNERSGNLVDGHRRVKALDLIRKYDGTPETDYEVKVESVDFDDKTEKEQMTYMAIKNSQADYNLIAKYIDDIDPSNVGISEEDVRQIQLLQDSIDEIQDVDMGDADDLFLTEESMPAVARPQPTPVNELPRVEKTSDEIVQMHEEKPKMSVEDVKAAKQHCDNVANANNNSVDTFVFVDFGTVELKLAFCELLGKIPENSMRIEGDEIMKLIE